MPNWDRLLIRLKQARPLWGRISAENDSNTADISGMTELVKREKVDIK